MEFLMRSIGCLCVSVASILLSGCAASNQVSNTTAAGALGDGPRAASAESEPPKSIIMTETPTTTAIEDNWTIKRVGGDMHAMTTGSSGDYRFERSRVDTELPEDYPAPTPPGAIDIKKYPAARRAEVTGRMNADMGMNLGFWPLFQHIQRNEIAMTSPVEMDYRAWSNTRGENPDAWTMSFLYRTPDMGSVGSDGRVRVVDTKPVIMLSIGMNGPYRLAAVRTGLARLQEWLASQSEWAAVEGADPRAMYYNDPSVPDRFKWMEVQMPVRRVAK